MFTGGTINLAAAWKWQNCGALCNHMFGFDTFTGLYMLCPGHRCLTVLYSLT